MGHGDTTTSHQALSANPNIHSLRPNEAARVDVNTEDNKSQAPLWWAAH